MTKFGRDIRRGSVLLYKSSDSVSVIGLVHQHDGARAEMVEQHVGDLPIVRLGRCQTEPDREPLCVDDRVDCGLESASGATEAMISIRFLPSRPAGKRERKGSRSSGCRQRVR